MQFEYYVLNYNPNANKIEPFNIFRNCYVQEYTEKAIKKYLRSPKNYKYERYGEETLYGFKALCEEIRSIIMWQEWSRREYEISVSDAFVLEVEDIYNSIDSFRSLEDLKEELEKQVKRNPKLEKWDCYKQCEPNIEMITRECIWQYKQQLKNNN